MIYVIFILQLLLVIEVAYFYYEWKQASVFRRATVDLEKVAESFAAQAIWDFSTDQIHPDSLDPYIRAKYLDLCSKTGLDPEFTDMVLSSARRLLPEVSDETFEVVGISLSEL